MTSLLVSLWYVLSVLHIYPLCPSDRPYLESIYIVCVVLVRRSSIPSNLSHFKVFVLDGLPTINTRRGEDDGGIGRQGGDCE